MARLITIQIEGDAGKYSAAVQRIQEQNARLYKDAEQGTQRVASQLKVWETSVTGLTSAVTTLAAAFAGSRIVQFIDSFSAFAEQLNAVSKRTGIAVEDLNALQRVAKLNEASFEELTTGFRFLNRALAEDKTSEQQKVLKALNITARDGKDAFFQLADRMRDNLSVADSYRAANILLGRSSENLINLLRLGGDAIRSQIEDQKTLGVISAETAEKADQIRDRWQQFFDVVQVKMGEPALDFLDQLQARLDSDIKLIDRIAEMWRNFTTSFGGATGSWEGKGASGGWQFGASGGWEAPKPRINLADALAKEGETAKKNAEAQKRLNEYIEISNRLLQEEEYWAKATAEAWDFYFKSIDDTARKKEELNRYLENANMALAIEDEQARTIAEAWDYYGQYVRKAEEANKRAADEAKNLATEVADFIGGITSSLIQGTLNWANIGRSILNSFLQDIIRSFAGLLSGGGGAGGGIISSIFRLLGVGGTAGSGSGGGFGGGLLGSIFGGIGNIWSLISNTQLVTTAISNISTIASSIASTVSTAVSSVLNSISWVPYIGWVIAAITAIYRIVANQQERPNVRYAATFGIGFDPVTQQFMTGNIITSEFHRAGISGSQSRGIASDLQQRLTLLADQWVGILNMFPNFLKEKIVPALDQVNQGLNQNFQRIKLSPGGSRNILQELQSISGPAGQTGMMNAFLPALAGGWLAALGRAGIPVNENIMPGGLGRIETPEGGNYLIEQMKKVVEITSNLARLSPGGISQFLTPQSTQYVSALFNQLFAAGDVQTFSNLAAKLEEQLKPVTDFLNSSIQTATDLFGRGLIAAMEAATESDAQLAFLNSLNNGIKDVVFQGLTQAFIASAQFSDLLAPIQQQIALFTERALTSGQAPDIGAFRTAILPAIEAISTRADLLGPLIDALQELGFNIKDLLRLNPKPEETAAPQNAFTINIYPGNISGDADVTDLARRIMSLLEPQLSPRA